MNLLHDSLEMNRNKGILFTRLKLKLEFFVTFFALTVWTHSLKTECCSGFVVVSIATVKDPLPHVFFHFPHSSRTF